MKMSRFFPPELLPNILARLPIADVIRCTSVCKSWYDLISSPFFISSHRNLSISNSERRVILRVRDGSDDVYYVHRDNQTFDEIKELEPPLRENPNISILGSSNGIFCCSGYFNDAIYMEKLILWNPSLDKHLILPESRVPRAGQQRHIGYGFLPSTNDFKIVRVIYTTTSYAKFILPPEIEVYKSSTGSWCGLVVTEFSYVLEPGCGQALLDGRVHWTACSPHGVGGKSLGLIVSFDLPSEKFDTLMLPKLAQDKEPVFFGVCTLKDSLGLLLHTKMKSSIYIMKEYGKQDSWEEMFNYDEIGYIPIYFRDNGEILGGEMDGENDTKWHLVSCDPKTGEVACLGLGEDDQYFVAAYAYVDTLFLLKQKQWI